MRDGEIFIVLKSDEVKPLADVEVIGFDKSFGAHFAEWQSKWNSVKPILSSDGWQDELNKLNRLIANARSLTNRTTLGLYARSGGANDDKVSGRMEKMRDENLVKLNGLEQLQINITQLVEQEKINPMSLSLRDICLKSFAAFISSNAICSTRTGGKGEFEIPGNVAFVFAGKVRPTTGEVPCWLVKVDYQQKSIRLSNSNLTAKDDSDELWMLQWSP